VDAWKDNALLGAGTGHPSHFRLYLVNVGVLLELAFFVRGTLFSFVDFFGPLGLKRVGDLEVELTAFLESLVHAGSEQLWGLVGGTRLVFNFQETKVAVNHGR
jgi:hypothetical protein